MAMFDAHPVRLFHGQTT